MVSAETRGRSGSEGEWRPYGDEGRDSYDAVEWAAEQPWSDGNVGLYGACALGLAAIQGAVEDHADVLPVSKPSAKRPTVTEVDAEAMGTGGARS